MERRNLTLYRGDTHLIEFVISGVNDLSQAKIVMDVVPSLGGSPLQPVIKVAGNVVEAHFASLLTHDIGWTQADYDMRLIVGSVVKTLARGKVKIEPSVTPVKDHLTDGGAIRRDTVVVSVAEPALNITAGLSADDVAEKFKAVESKLAKLQSKDEAAQLSQRLEEISGRLDGVDTKAQAAEESAEIARLQSQIQELRQKVDEAEESAEIQQLRAQLAVAESALAKSGGLEARLQALETAKQQSEEAAVELAQLKQQLLNKADSSEISGLKQQIQQARQELESRLNQLQSGGQVPSGEIQALTQRVQTLETDLRQAQQDILAKSSSQDVQALQEQIRQQQAKLQKLDQIETELQQIRTLQGKPKRERIHLRQDVWSNGGYPYTTVTLSNSYTNPRFSVQVLHTNLSTNFPDINISNVTANGIRMRSTMNYAQIDVDYMVYLFVEEWQD